MSNYYGTGRRLNKQFVRQRERNMGLRKSLQDEFLNRLIEEEVQVDLFLRNESVRSGQILAYDNWSVLVLAQDKQYLFFKASIMGIIPERPIEIDLGHREPPYDLVSESSERYYGHYQ